MAFAHSYNRLQRLINWSKVLRKMIKSLRLGLIFVTFGFSAAAQANPEISYYYGVSDIRILLPNQLPITHEEMLMKRIVDPENGYLVELACLHQEGKLAYLSPFYMKVEGDQIKIADSVDTDHPKNFKGTAKVSGPDWNWNFLQFTMDWLPSPSKIIDINIVTDTQIIARKKILTPNGLLFETYEVDGSKISVEEFNLRASSMGCPEFNGYP